MADPRFYNYAGPFSLETLAEKLGGKTSADHGSDADLKDLKPLDGAGPEDVTYFGNAKYAAALAETQAGACLIREADLSLLPEGVGAIIVDAPDVSYIEAVSVFYPEDYTGEVSVAAHVHADARLEENVTVEPGAVIDAGVEVGANSVIGANAVIGKGVKIGRDCRIHPNATIRYALMGDRVVVLPGAAIGNDGHGFSSSGEGHKRIPQIGRVILQDDVEIGANCTIDRGAMDDTVIGEGTKLDNMVHIGHNCVIGRHCMIVGQVGMSGSTKVGDFVTMGGQVGTVGHIEIGDFSILAARAGVTKSLPGGDIYAGFPAQKFKDWQKEQAAIRRLSRGRSKKPAK